MISAYLSISSFWPWMPKNGGIRRRFMKGKSEWPSSCSQDIIYPALVGTAQWFSGWCWWFICHWVQTSLKIRSNVKLLGFFMLWTEILCKAWIWSCFLFPKKVIHHFLVWKQKADLFGVKSINLAVPRPGMFYLKSPNKKWWRWEIRAVDIQPSTKTRIVSGKKWDFL